MAPDQIRTAFECVFYDASQGDFLRGFAQAVIYADPDNFELLRPVAERLIGRYQLSPQPSPEE
jgi:hypothetical protein